MALQFQPPPEWLAQQLSSDPGIGGAVTGGLDALYNAYDYAQKSKAAEREQELRGMKLQDEIAQNKQVRDLRMKEYELARGKAASEGYGAPSEMAQASAEPQRIARQGELGLVQDAPTPFLQHLKTQMDARMAKKNEPQVYFDPQNPQTQYSLPANAKPLPQERLPVEKPPVGQVAVDKAVGKEYADFIAGGGYADPAKNLSQIDYVVKELEAGTQATGPIVGAIGRFGRERVIPKGAALQDAVEEVVQRNLRAILGPQFTQAEGDRLITRSYNPSLPESENIRRLKNLKSQMASALQSKNDAMRYFESNNGSMKGFKGRVYKSASDFEPESSVGSGSTSDMVRVISPSGQTGSYPRAKLAEALKRGFKEVQ